MKKITHKEYLDYQMAMIVARLGEVELSRFKGFETLAKDATDLFLKHNSTVVSDEVDEVKKHAEAFKASAWSEIKSLQSKIKSLEEDITFQIANRDRLYADYCSQRDYSEQLETKLKDWLKNFQPTQLNPNNPVLKDNSEDKDTGVKHEP